MGLKPLTTLKSAKNLQADVILKASVVLIGVLVLALTAVLASESTLHSRTLETISLARGARDATLQITQTLAHLESARASGAPTQGIAEDARGRGRRLLELSADDAALRVQASRIADVIEDHIMEARPGPDIHADLRNATDLLRQRLNEINDGARNAENAARFRLASVAGALALLALAAAGLAMLALRRERSHWRESHAIAEDARERAAASDLAKTRFLAVASHDMRQPLHALALYISALQRRVDNEEARDILAKMERATHSMAGMFATLLDLARIHAGVVKPDTATFALQDTLNRIVAQHPGGAVEAEPTDVALHTDQAILEGALRNLVANAIKHGGGRARIEVKRMGARVEIVVADDGPGIAQEDQERIFEEFVRLEKGGRGEGLGLGLSIVQRVASLLGMELQLYSEPGKGARFVLRTEAAADEAAAPAPNPDANDALTGVAALVVDDDQLAREALAGLLRDSGADVRAAGDEPGARAIIEAGFAPSLIMMDLRIDGRLEGVEIGRRLAAMSARAPQVIIVTGDTAPETLAMLRGAGCRWLIKPVGAEALRQAAAEAAV